MFRCAQLAGWRRRCSTCRVAAIRSRHVHLSFLRRAGVLLGLACGKRSLRWGGLPFTKPLLPFPHVLHRTDSWLRPRICPAVDVRADLFSGNGACGVRVYARTSADDFKPLSAAHAQGVGCGSQGSRQLGANGTQAFSVSATSADALACVPRVQLFSRSEHACMGADSGCYSRVSGSAGAGPRAEMLRDT